MTRQYKATLIFLSIISVLLMAIFALEMGRLWNEPVGSAPTVWHREGFTIFTTDQGGIEVLPTWAAIPPEFRGID